jgi:hypothetical protein
VSGLGRPIEAAASYREALRLRPNYPEAHTNLGRALYELGRPAEAEASCREALRLRPNYPEAHNDLGNALYGLGRPAEAAASYREALRLRPNYPEAHTNLGRALLMAGRFEEGWKEHEWRWKVKTSFSSSARDFSAPLWRGEAIGDRTILLHAEQGLGDTLQFCRYAPLIVCNGRIILEVQAPLVRLLSRLLGVMQIVARGDNLPPFDLHCPLMSLPHAFGTTLDTIPAAMPYLSADPVRVAFWRDRIGTHGRRIGIVWQGNPVAPTQRGRSVPLREFLPLAQVPDVRLISLQKHHGLDQLASIPDGLKVETLGDDFDAGPDAFIDAAAVMQCLDMVIASDTSIAHLAGALGRPVWVVVHHVPDWRWLLEGEDCLWYPTMRLFRQPVRGDWGSAFARMATELSRAALLGRAVGQDPGDHART